MIGQIHVMAQKLMDEGKLEEAVRMYQDTVMYDWATEADATTYQNLSKMYKKLGNQLYSRALAFQATMLKGEQGKYAKQTKEEQHKLEKKLQAQPEEYTLYYQLAANHVLQLQMVEACIYYKVYEKYGQVKRVPKDEVYPILCDYQSVKRLYDQLADEEHTYCVVLGEEPLDILIQALSKLGKAVYGVRRFPKDEPPRSDEEVGEILRELYETDCQEASWIVLGDTVYMKQLLQDVRQMKMMQQLYTEGVKRCWSSLGAYFLGNYLYTAKYLYGFDVHQAMSETPQVKVSIVVPVKNCSYTLKQTLETCLDQRSTNYEIVVSDNSDTTYTGVWDLVQELNDPKIKYYRTPYPLPLVKSFEYAYLRAQGEFIFSIGADDGVLPYAVTYLEKILEELPDENVITWPRLFYVWPELTASGIADTFSFPQGSERERIQVSYVETHPMMMEMIGQLNSRVNNMYNLPMLYINSGMRRRHILEMIKRTGKFLDGTSQDVYTGILNMAMYDKILHNQTPLTVAGMSSSSIGASSVLVNQSIKKYKRLVEGYNSTVDFVAIPGTPSQQMLYPQFDYALFVYELLKVYDLDIHEKCTLWKEAIDMKQLLDWIARDNGNRPSEGIDFAGYITACAYKQSEELGRWFEQLCHTYGRPRNDSFSIDGEAQPREKAYFKGSAGGWLTLDASEFEIAGIKDAVAFFVKLYNL